jgi:hypothetical protein
VTIIEYNSEAKANLIGELFKSKCILHFLKWQCIQHTDVLGNILNIDTTNIYRNVCNPVWVFVVFQMNRSNNRLKDNGIFDHVIVRNLWMEIGGKRYPEESWGLDWKNNIYCLAYDTFQDFKRIFIETGSIACVDKQDFKKLYQIYSIDFSDQPQSITSPKSSIILHVDFNKDISAPSGTDGGTNCNIFVLSKCLLRYDPYKI